MLLKTEIHSTKCAESSAFVRSDVQLDENQPASAPCTFRSGWPMTYPFQKRRNGLFLEEFLPNKNHKWEFTDFYILVVWTFLIS